VEKPDLNLLSRFAVITSCQGAVQNIVMSVVSVCLFVCLFVCMSARISLKPHDKAVKIEVFRRLDRIGVPGVVRRGKGHAPSQRFILPHFSPTKFLFSATGHLG